MAIKWQNWVYGDVYAGDIEKAEYRRAWYKTRENIALAARRRYRQTGIKRKVYVLSGPRSYAEQKRLYDAYMNGTGNPANRPGTSTHEFGTGADVYVKVNGELKPVGSLTMMRRAFNYWKIKFPYLSREPWHGERYA